MASRTDTVLISDANAARRRCSDHNTSPHNIYRSFGDVRSTAEVMDLLSRP